MSYEEQAGHMAKSKSTISVSGISILCVCAHLFVAACIAGEDGDSSGDQSIPLAEPDTVHACGVDDPPTSVTVGDEPPGYQGILRDGDATAGDAAGYLDNWQYGENARKHSVLSSRKNLAATVWAAQPADAAAPGKEKERDIACALYAETGESVVLEHVNEQCYKFSVIDSDGKPLHSSVAQFPCEPAAPINNGVLTGNNDVAMALYLHSCNNYVVLVFFADAERLFILEVPPMAVNCGFYSYTTNYTPAATYINFWLDRVRVSIEDDSLVSIGLRAVDGVSVQVTSATDSLTWVSTDDPEGKTINEASNLSMFKPKE